MLAVSAVPRRRACSSIPRETSMAVTRAPSSARRRATLPFPHATSRTRQPATSPSSRSAAGRINCRWNSLPASPICSSQNAEFWSQVACRSRGDAMRQPGRAPPRYSCPVARRAFATEPTANAGLDAALSPLLSCPRFAIALTTGWGVRSRTRGPRGSYEPWRSSERSLPRPRRAGACARGPCARGPRGCWKPWQCG